MNRTVFGGCAILGLILFAIPVAYSAPLAPVNKAIPILLDTDIGSDIDDAFALALILASPELDLRGVATVGTEPQMRARIVCRVLTAAGRREIPVAAGENPQPREEIEKQGRYVQSPDEPGTRAAKPIKESAVEFLYQQLKARPGELTIVAIGPLTNIARLFNEHPDCKLWVKHLVLMAGSVRLGYKGQAPPEPEWNIKCDIPSAKAVFASGVPLVVAPLDATTMLRLKEPLRRRLFDARTVLTDPLRQLYKLWEQPTPTLYDPVAVTLCFDEHFCTMEEMCLTVDDKGMTAVAEGKANARVATAIRSDEFLAWYVDRVASAKPAPARKQ